MSPITGFCSYSLGMVAPWTPASLGSALIAWYKADTGVTTSSGNVTSVTDQSGNGYTLTNTGTVPFSATGFNSLPTFNFLAANTALLKTSASVNMGGTIAGSCFCVGQMLTAATNFAGAMVYGSGSGNDFSDTGTSSAWITRNGTANSLVTERASITSNSAAMSLATNHRFGVTYDASGSMTVYVDNVANTPAANVSTVAFGASGTIIIGGRYSAGAPSTGNAWEGPISEIVVTNTSLSSGDRSNLDTYFRNKWGI